jgi:O-antigen/teichoic acid export membrane protein
MILFCALLLWGGVSSPSNPFKIEWYIYCQTAAYVLTVIITLLLVFNKAKIRKITWRPAFFLVILKKSYPYAILVLLMTFYNRIDAVMLERILADGEIQSSIYASAYRLLDAANMIAYLFAGLLLPIFARMIKLRHRLEDLVKLSFSLLIVLSFTAATGTWFFSKDLTEMLYTHHTEASAQVLQLLMCCFVFVSTTYVFGTLLTANGNLRELNIMAFSGMLLNIGLNFVLIPHYKAAGSAASSLITQGLTAIAQVILAARVFKFKTDYIFLFRIALFCLFTAAAGYFISVKLPSQGALSALLILGAGAPIVALATGVISIPGLLKAIREDV